MAQSAGALPPLPAIDDLTRPFWEGTRQGKLLVQRCPDSGRRYYPPRPLCPDCMRADLPFEQVSGNGTIYTFVVMHDRRVRGFEDRVPYINVWVELEEQPFLTITANLLDADPADVEIGMPVEVTFERLTDEVVLPQFRLRA